MGELTDIPGAASFIKKGGEVVAEPTVVKGKGRVAKKELVRQNGQKLTPKQAKFVRGVAEGKPAYKAAVEAYDTDDLNVANAIAVENLQKPTIREALESAMEKAGITIEKAIEPIQEALAYEGDTERDTLDMRLKGSDRALKLMGASQSDKEPGSAAINFNFGTQTFVKKVENNS